MTEIEQKALALVNEVNAERNRPNWRYLERSEDLASEALCRAIEQHEQFKRKVSDAVHLAIDRCGHDGLRAGHINEYLGRFILPKPVDPLVEVLKYMGTHPSVMSDQQMADEFRAALAKSGLEVREIEG